MPDNEIKKSQVEGVNNINYRYDAFISYRHKGGVDHAIALKERLRRLWYTVYMDVYYQNGGPFPIELDEALRKSRNLVVIISSKDCFKRKENGEEDFFLLEIFKALEQDKTIIPVYYGDIKYEDIKDNLKVYIDEYLKKKDVSVDDKASSCLVKKFSQYESVSFRSDEPKGSFNQIAKKLNVSFFAKMVRKLYQKIHLILILFLLMLIIAGIIISPIILINRWSDYERSNNHNQQKILDSISITYREIVKPKMVFAGGGSVINYILKTTNDVVDVRKYENSICLDLPSKSAWSLLTEELVIQHYNDSVNSFYPVCLSAIEANKSNLIIDSVTLKNENKNHIISYELGDDTLMICIKKDYLLMKAFVDIIDINTLINIINKERGNSNFTIFTTNKESGTYLQFQKALNNILSDNKINTRIFNDKTDIIEFNNRLKPNGIVLTSQYYIPNALKEDKDYKKLYIKNTKGLLSKKLFLYFVGYHVEKNGHHYVNIPKPMIKFLNGIISCNDNEKLLFFNKILSRSNNDYIKMPLDETDPVFISFDTLIKWYNRNIDRMAKL